MARTADPHRRAELLDQIVDYLTGHGLSTLSMRPLAQHLGKSTRVLTHHFADKEALLSATMERLDERHRAWLRSLPGWMGSDSVGTIIRRTWDWQTQEENLPIARLIHEIEGLAAAGKLAGHVPRLLADRSEFVAGLLCERGMPQADALRISTLANSAYTGLQIDFLTTGDRERVEAALDQLCTLVDGWVASA
ncbi:TetR/AcrR family transcriptional regulator [Streptosporangium roseum]|uniref:Transcriptional regulator, TetR family n=1 Tax=Streptosporangium roseum (strain ATCC 12428 / DSM 43021 / JCM 3005 / KCTC 9067 / NCIMB 10171 / NRRL 2505 / NI 9100) TaxID=479432 RepID=D2B554_STRRD|nr:TetR/AcrR family transcriptional regulator [Streptosporangium roseum]ACZ87578.1 putative transcriptional regulator, TetR family [Streptosporangium roseum DSM 43021]